MASSHRQSCARRLVISAVVPTLNEEGGISATLESLRRGGVDEVIVVDGGSEDDTLARVRPLADRVVTETAGLFEQLNRGAEGAAGDVVVFHYADVLFPEDGGRAIAAALDAADVLGGAFRLSLNSGRWRYRFTALCANGRNRLGLGPFGDQSLFVRASVFRDLGCFASDEFFADLGFVKRLRRRGRFRLLPQTVKTSTRRWERLGWARTHVYHYWLYGLYLTGLGKPTRRHREKARAWRAVR